MSRISFQLSSNLRLQISRSNYMSANQLVDQLLSLDNKFTLKKDNVVKSLENMLYSGREILGGEYDCLTGIIYLDISDEAWRGDSDGC